MVRFRETEREESQRAGARTTLRIICKTLNLKEDEAEDLVQGKSKMMANPNVNGCFLNRAFDYKLRCVSAR